MKALVTLAAIGFGIAAVVLATQGEAAGAMIALICAIFAGAAAAIAYDESD